MATIVGQTIPCRICHQNLPPYKRRQIFSHSFLVFDQLSEVLYYHPHIDDGLSKHICVWCYGKLHKLSKIDYDLKHGIDELKQKKKTIMQELRLTLRKNEVIIPHQQSRGISDVKAVSLHEKGEGADECNSGQIHRILPLGCETNREKKPDEDTQVEQGVSAGALSTSGKDVDSHIIDHIRDSSFGENLRRNLCRLYKELILCDVSLMCSDGVELPAHWLVLSLHSEYLQQLALSCSRMPNISRYVKLNIESSVMKTILDYCYEGRLNVTRASWHKIEEAATCLQLHAVLGTMKLSVFADQKDDKPDIKEKIQIETDQKRNVNERQVANAQTKKTSLATKSDTIVKPISTREIGPPKKRVLLPKPSSVTNTGPHFMKQMPVFVVTTPPGNVSLETNSTSHDPQLPVISNVVGSYSEGPTDNQSAQNAEETEQQLVAKRRCLRSTDVGSEENVDKLQHSIVNSTLRGGCPDSAQCTEPELNYGIKVESVEDPELGEYTVFAQYSGTIPKEESTLDREETDGHLHKTIKIEPGIDSGHDSENGLQIDTNHDIKNINSHSVSNKNDSKNLYDN